MQLAANMITIDDPVSANELAQQIRNNRNQRSAVRRVANASGRNQKKERNLSAMLPRLERPRYDEREAQDVNIVNFVKASRRQMKDAIQQQQPQARKFFDESLSKVGDSAKSAIKELEMPHFSNSQITRLRPSIHSVTNSVNRRLQLSLPKMDEESDVESSVAATKLKPLRLDNLTALISPQNNGTLTKNVSKVSLITDSYHAGLSMSAPGSVQTNNRLKAGSPSAAGSSVVQAFGRELKHLNKYLDAREMQIRAKLENTQKLDGRLEYNAELQELFHSVIAQVRSKLPASSASLGDLVKRIMDSLGECFELQNRTFGKKVDIRNKKIEALKNELETLKASFAAFKKDSTIEAFFKKHTDIVDRTGRREKDYMRDLNVFVDDYLRQTDTFETLKVSDERQAAKEAEPSGAETMLIQLQQVSSKIDVPGVPENPLLTLDAEKDTVMQDFKRALNKEAHTMRYAVEQHVKGQFGLVKPVKDSEAQTLTFTRLKHQIVDSARDDIEKQTYDQMKEKFDIRTARWQKDMEVVEKKSAQFKQKMHDMQRKLAKSDGDTYVEIMREKIITFFNLKLGKKNNILLKEFNEKIMEIRSTEVGVNRLLKSISSIHETESELARLKIQTKFDNVLKSSSSRPSLTSNDIVKVVDRQGSLMRSMDSNDSMDQAQIARDVNNSPSKQPPQSQGNAYDDLQSPAKLGTAKKSAMKKKVESDADDSGNEYGEETPKATREDSPEKLSQKKSRRSPTQTAVAAEERHTPDELAVSDKSPSPSPSRVASKLKDGGQRIEPISPTDTDRGATPFSKKQKSPQGSPRQSPKGSVKTRKGSNPGSPLPQSSLKHSDGGAATPFETKEIIDDRSDLLNTVNGVKAIMKGFKEYQGANKLKNAAKKAQKAIDMIMKVQSAAEILYKIVELNTDDDSLKSESSSLKLSAEELSMQDLVPIRKTVEKITKGKEMHKLCDSASKFLKDAKSAQKKGKEMPARDAFLAQISALDRIKEMATNLPIKAEIEQITTAEKKGSEIDSQLMDLVMRKLVKPPATAVSAKSGAVSVKTLKLATVTSNGDKSEIGDAITSIQTVRNQIEQSHAVILNAQDVGKSEEKLLRKVNRLLTHMDEAVNWLEQKRVDENAQLVASDSEEAAHGSSHHRPNKGLQQFDGKPLINFQDREKALRSKDGKNYTATEWDGLKTPTPPLVNFGGQDQHALQHAAENGNAFKDRKQTEPAVSKKMMSLQQNAQNYLTANDIQAVQEDAKREQTGSKVSSQRHGANPSDNAADKSKLGQIGEEDTDADLREGEQPMIMGARRSSRIEVFRKTPHLKGALDGSEYVQLQASETDSTPLGTQPKPQQSGDLAEDLLTSRKQFVDLDMDQAEMTYTFANGQESPTMMNGVIVQRKQGSPIAIKGENAKLQNIAAALRQSGTETDYLKTASHFGNETFRADLSRINVGITSASPNPNETQNFLDNLKQQAAVDPRGGATQIAQYPEHSIRQEMQQKKLMDGGSLSHAMNKDLEDTRQFVEGSQGSSIAEQDLSLDSPLAHQSPQYSTDERRMLRNVHPVGPIGQAVKMPSQLRISQKPVHQLIKVHDTGIIGYLAQDLYAQSQRSSKLYQRKPRDAVLMLTQATQTENRGLIKQLLTMINETIMKQLEGQSVQMTKEEFEEQVEQLKAAIPSVYDQVKDNSDTFFIEQFLGAHYPSASPRGTSATNLVNTQTPQLQPQLQPQPQRQPQSTQLLQQPQQLSHQQQTMSNKDLNHMMPHDTHQTHQTIMTRQTASTGIGNVVIGKKNLSPSPSLPTLNRDLSKQRILDQMGLPRSPSEESMIKQQVPRKQPFLSLGDFSRYGNHTLEISQEVRQRVNLRQVGAAGGGFMGRGVRVRPPPTQQ